jgi:hypothetical protein
LGRLEAIHEAAELGFEFKQTGFEEAAVGTIKERIAGRSFHPTTMADSLAKRKTRSSMVNRYDYS